MAIGWYMLCICVYYPNDINLHVMVNDRIRRKYSTLGVLSMSALYLKLKKYLGMKYKIESLFQILEICILTMSKK